MSSKKDYDDSDDAAAPLRTQRVPVVDVRDLVGAGREALIRHNGEFYRLRITAAGKLILTK